MTDKQFFKRLWWVVVGFGSIVLLSILLTIASSCEDLYIAGYNKEFEKLDSLMLSADSIIYEINTLMDTTDWDAFYLNAQRINND